MRFAIFGFSDFQGPEITPDLNWECWANIYFWNLLGQAWSMETAAGWDEMFGQSQEHLWRNADTLRLDGMWTAIGSIVPQMSGLKFWPTDSEKTLPLSQQLNTCFFLKTKQTRKHVTTTSSVRWPSPFHSKRIYESLCQTSPAHLHEFQLPSARQLRVQLIEAVGRPHGVRQIQWRLLCQGPQRQGHQLGEQMLQQGHAQEVAELTWQPHDFQHLLMSSQLYTFFMRPRELDRMRKAG